MTMSEYPETIKTASSDAASEQTALKVSEQVDVKITEQADAKITEQAGTKEAEHVEPKASDHSDSKKKKAVASSAVAVITAASMMVSGAIDSPVTLLSDDDDSHRKASHTFMMAAGSIDNGLEEYSEDDEDDDENEDEEEETSIEAALTFRERIRNTIMEMPLVLRCTLILPLWLIGSGLTFVTSAAWQAAAPFVTRLLSFLLILAIIFGAFVVSAKILHPELPLKKFFNKRTVPTLLIGGIALCALDLVLTIAGVKFPVKDVFVCIGHLAVLSTALIVLTKFLKKTKQGRFAPLKPVPQPTQEPVKEKKPAVVFTDSTGTLQRIRFREEEEQSPQN